MWMLTAEMNCKALLKIWNVRLAELKAELHTTKRQGAQIHIYKRQELNCHIKAERLDELSR